MSIRHAILGFLSWKPFSGYELKKLFADSLSFHWSGNSNQVYGALIGLHGEGAVTVEVMPGGRHPDRKVYAITESGKALLKDWLLSETELPELKNHFHTRLAWAEALSREELDRVFMDYEALLEGQVLMCRERARREGTGTAAGAAAGAGAEAAAEARPERSPRERLIWRRVEESRLAAFETELSWLRALRAELSALS